MDLKNLKDNKLAVVTYWPKYPINHGCIVFKFKGVLYELGDGTGLYQVWDLKDINNGILVKTNITKKDLARFFLLMRGAQLR